MIKTSLVVAVKNVRESSKWYQHLLGCKSPLEQDNDHRDLFDVLQNDAGNTILALSRWDHNSLAPLAQQAIGKPGLGIVPVFSVNDFEESWERAKELNAKVVLEPHESRGFKVSEYTIVDLDGYVITVSAWGKA